MLLQRRRGDKVTRVLIDTTPDIVSQLNDADAGTLDAVWYSHEHADHIHGIDDLRQVAINMRSRVKVWASRSTTDMLMTRFSYCFVTPPGSSYPPILELNGIEPDIDLTIDGAAGTISATPFLVNHGDIDALGFRIGDVAYTPDLISVPKRSIPVLSDLDVWIVDALRRTPHPSHFHLDLALEWIDRMKPRRAILTNMHVDMDYAALRSQLPSHVEPAYDGMVVSIPDKGPRA